jgi:hypothetical protein
LKEMVGRAYRVLLIASMTVLACNGEPAAGDGGVDAVAAADALADARVMDYCDPVTQDGCEEGEKCTIVPSGIVGGPAVIGCVDADGDLGAMEPCSRAMFDSPDNCLPGLSCRGTVDPRCLPFCTDYPEDTCDEGQICALGEDIDGDFWVDVEFCALTCDPLAQDCTEEIQACYPTRGGAICAPEGAGDEPVAEGELCLYANSCGGGLGCLLSESFEWLCYKLCDLEGGEPSCSPVQVCNPFEDEPWGVCIDIY